MMKTDAISIEGLLRWAAELSHLIKSKGGGSG